MSYKKESEGVWDGFTAHSFKDGELCSDVVLERIRLHSSTRGNEECCPYT